MSVLIFVGLLLFVLGVTIGLATGGNAKRIGKLLLFVVCGVACVLAGLFGLEQLAEAGGWVPIALILLATSVAMACYALSGIRAVRNKSTAPAVHLAGGAAALTVLGLLYLLAGGIWGFGFLILGSVAAVFSLFASHPTKSVKGIRNTALLVIGAFWVLSGTALLAAGDAIPGAILLVGFGGLILAIFPQIVSRLRRPTAL